jgi:hypothetical protein
MRTPGSTPRLVPEFDLAVHIVLDDFGTADRVYRETDEERARLGTVDDFLTGQFNRPLRIVAFKTAEGWSQDVSEDVAWEVLHRARKEGRTLSGQHLQFRRIPCGRRRDLTCRSRPCVMMLGPASRNLRRRTCILARVMSIKNGQKVTA